MYPVPFESIDPHLLDKIDDEDLVFLIEAALFCVTRWAEAREKSGNTSLNKNLPIREKINSLPVASESQIPG